MLSPVLTPPSDPDFLHVLNRRLEDLSTAFESLKAQQSVATTATTATPAATDTAAAVGSLISTTGGTRKQRLVYVPQQLTAGSTWWETDRQVLYVVQLVNAAHSWQYLAGTMRGTLSAKPTDLTTADAGLLYFATDYARTFRWTGSAWENAPGETAQGAISFFDGNPGTGWSIADGTTTTFSTATAGTTSKAKPNVVGAYIKGASTYTGTQTAASGSISGSTATESGHTHSIDHDHAAVSSDGPSGLTALNYTSGASLLNVATTHAHNVDLPAFTGTSGSGSAHSHGVGTLALSGVEPAHISGIPYVRL